MIKIMFRGSDWKRLKCYLTSRSDVETGAYAIFKTSICNNTKKFLVTQVMIPNEKDYYKRSPVAVAFNPDFTEKAIQQCESCNGNLLDIHTHPWSSEVDFSSIDDREAKHTKAPYITKYVPKTMIAFIVFGKSPTIAKARYWNQTANKLSWVNKIIVV